MFESELKASAGSPMRTTPQMEHLISNTSIFMETWDAPRSMAMSYMMKYYRMWRSLCPFNQDGFGMLRLYSYIFLQLQKFFFLFLYLPLWRPFEFTLILTAIFGLELGLAWMAYHCGNDLGGLQLKWTMLKIWMIERPKSSGLRLCFPHTTWHSYACMPDRLYVHGPSILISHHTNVGRAMRATLSFMSISVLCCTTNSETQLGSTWTTQLEPHGVSRCPWTHGLCSELRPRFLNPSPAVFHMLC